MAKRIAVLREPRSRNADWVLCKTGEVFNSPASADHNKPVFIGKDVFYTDSTCTAQKWETNWESLGYSDAHDLLVSHFGLSADEAEKILNR